MVPNHRRLHNQLQNSPLSCITRDDDSSRRGGRPSLTGPWHKPAPPSSLLSLAQVACGRRSLSKTSSSLSAVTSHLPHGRHHLLPPFDATHAVQSLAPTLLLGIATALLYRSVVRHPASHLSGRSATYMLLLAVQVAVQPRISRWAVRSDDSKVTLALLEEVCKTALAGTFWFLQGPEARSRSRLPSPAWSLPASLASAGIPAALYAVQGVLTYASLQRLDAVTFNGLSQLKTASAALFCYLILGTTQSAPQIAAIALLVASALLFQRQKRKEPSPSASRSFLSKDPTTKPQNRDPPSQQQDDSGAPSGGSGAREDGDRATGVSIRGVSACLAATAISGLAGALSQRGVQSGGSRSGTGGGGRDPYLYCAEVSAYSALCLLFSSLPRWVLAAASRRRVPLLSSLSCQPDSRDARAALRSSTPPHAHQRPSSGPTVRWQLLIPVVVKALGGIATVLVHKHAGSVPKGFALVLGLVLSGMLEREPLTFPQLLGTVLVLASSWVHFTSSA